MVSVYQASGDTSARAALLPAIASGSAVGVLLADDCWREAPRLARSSENSAYVDGVAGNVPDGAAASVAIACIGAGREAAIVQFDLKNRRAVADQSLDLLHPCASFRFDHSEEARVLARGEGIAAVWRNIVDRYALFMPSSSSVLPPRRSRWRASTPAALCLRPAHRLVPGDSSTCFADLFVALDLARSNCLFGAAACRTRRQNRCTRPQPSRASRRPRLFAAARAATCRCTAHWA